MVLAPQKVFPPTLDLIAALLVHFCIFTPRDAVATACYSVLLLLGCQQPLLASDCCHLPPFCICPCCGACFGFLHLLLTHPLCACAAGSIETKSLPDESRRSPELADGEVLTPQKVFPPIIDLNTALQVHLCIFHSRGCHHCMFFCTAVAWLPAAPAGFHHLPHAISPQWQL